MRLPKSSRRAPLRLHTLEARENPANLVTSYVGTTLVLTGSEQAENFTVKPGAVAGTYDLTADDAGTTIDGATTISTQVVTSIKMVLKGGDDSVTADAGFAFAVPGALAIDGGDGVNTVTLATTASPVTLGSFSYVGGTGADTLTLGQAGAATTVNGEISVKGGLGTDAVTLTGVTAKKSVAFDAGAGGSTLAVTGGTVTGGLSYKALEGDDELTLNGAAVNGKAGVSVSAGHGDADLITLGTVAVPAGGVAVAGTGGKSDADLGGTLTVFGDLKLSNLEVDVDNAAALSVNNLSLAAADLLTVTTTGGTWAVAKNLTLAAASPVGGAGMTFDNLTVGGNLTSTSGQGQTLAVNSGEVKGAVSLTSKTGGAVLKQTGAGAVTFRKTVAVKAYGGARVQFNSTGSATVGGDMTVTSAVGVAEVSNTAGDLTLGGVRAAGYTAAEVKFLADDPGEVGTVARDVLATAKAGTVNIITGAADLTFSGKVTAQATGKADVGAGAGGAVTFRKDVAVTSTTAEATATVGGALAAAFNGKLTVAGFGSGLIDFHSAGAVTTGSDAAVASAGGVAEYRNDAGDVALGGGLKVAGAVSGQANFRADDAGEVGTVAKDVSVTAKTGSAFVSARAADLTLSGKVTVLGATDAFIGGSNTGTAKFLKDVAVTATYRDAAVTFGGGKAATFGGKVTVTGGEDAEFSLSGPAAAAPPATVAGDVAVTAARGTATLNVQNDGKAFAGNVALKGYAVNAMVNTTTATTFGKTFKATGGAGDDTLLIGGLYTVAGDAAFNLGDGGSAVILFSSGDATETEFAGNLTVTGGAGGNTTTFVNVQTAKAVTYNAFGGTDVLYVDGGSVIGGALTADLGAGDDSIDFGRATGLPTAPAATFTGKVTVKAGAGNDTLFLGRSIANDAGDANSRAVFSAVGSTIDGGTGLNDFDDEKGQPLPTANLAVNGFVDVNGP